MFAGGKEPFSRRRHGDGTAAHTSPLADVPSAAKRSNLGREQCRQDFTQNRGSSFLETADGSKSRCPPAVLTEPLDPATGSGPVFVLFASFVDILSSIA
jgi:hypothetical protein